VERCIPRLLFGIDKEHLVTGADVEGGEGGEKLKKFKEPPRENLWVSCGA